MTLWRGHMGTGMRQAHSIAVNDQVRVIGCQPGGVKFRSQWRGR